MANNLKNYDGQQVLRSVFDVEKNCLRVCVVDGTTGGGDGFEVIITHTSDSIRLGNGTSFFTSSTVLGKIGLDVAIINDVDIRQLDASIDNVAIHDANGDELGINADGSINTTSQPAANISSVNMYGEISSLASNTETTLASYTAIAGRETFFQKIAVSGENIAEYRVKVSGTLVDKKRTYFGQSLNAEFKYDGELNSGYRLSPGQILTVTVIHKRPVVGDFNARLTILEVL